VLVLVVVLAVQAVFSGSGRDQPKKEAKIKVRGSL
jgi:hypothetical protein